MLNRSATCAQIPKSATIPTLYAIKTRTQTRAQILSKISAFLCDSLHLNPNTSRAQTRAQPERPRMSSQIIHTEAQEQQRLAQALDTAGYLWTATANGGKRSASSGAALKASGVKAGVPDVLVFSPTVQAPQGAAVELKRIRPRKGRTSAEQRIWIERLNAAGIRAAVCYGAADAVDYLRGLGYCLELALEPEPTTPPQETPDHVPPSRHSRAALSRKRRRDR